MRAEVPSRWKTANVIPIPKKPPYTSANNYRPISITSVFSRVLEKILKKRIESHLHKYSIISPLQHTNDWSSILEEGKSIDVVYLDFSKAFDKVSHSKLIAKLSVVGIHPRLISWIREFLSGRAFRVRVKHSFSTPKVATSGVPQGGVLSPVLFNIYTFELPCLISSMDVNCCAFADDLKMYKTVSSALDCRTLQDALNSVHQWSITWGLPISKEKTKLLSLGTRRVNYDYTRLKVRRLRRWSRSETWDL